MKPYTYQIGKGTDDNLEMVLYSQEVVAYNLDEAIDKAKAVTRLRPVHANEEIVRLLDETRDAKLQIVWTRSAKDIRDV